MVQIPLQIANSSFTLKKPQTSSFNQTIEKLSQGKMLHLENIFCNNSTNHLDMIKRIERFFYVVATIMSNRQI